jgi:Tfp pilus assembly protein PilF
MRDARAWNEYAWARLQSGQPDLALEYARRAHELARRNPDYLNTVGVAHGELGELDAARLAFEKALRLRSDHVDALVNLAKVLEKQDDWAAAARAYARAYALAPEFPRLSLALARAYRQLGRAEEAKRLVERRNDELGVLALAECEFELLGESAALERLRGAVATHPDWTLARAALAHLLLSTEHWREGWRLYRPAARRALPADGRIALRGEQGIGDVLFFLRFVPELNARGMQVTLACEKKLLSIVKPGALLHQVVEDAPGIPIGDLPLALESETTPPPWPLAAQKADLSALGPPPYLGVTWRAGTDVARRREFGNDPGALTKAIDPALLGAALRGWPGTILLLQRGARPADRQQFALPGIDLSHLGEDLPALLPVLAALDEYVGVSNANMHFLAGLGKTARVLVPYPGEWRWLRREGPSPWFPGFAVYRQPQSRDWGAVLARLRADLGLK